MSVNIIVAVGKPAKKGFPIGRKGKIPWKNKDDMKWFTATTKGHPIIMGRKTYESIGHPLPDRFNIVVTSNEDLFQDNKGVRVSKTLENAISYAKTIDNEIFIIGGESLYTQALEKKLVDKIFINFLEENVENADTFFPKIDESNYKLIDKINETISIYDKVNENEKQY